MMAPRLAAEAAWRPAWSAPKSCAGRPSGVRHRLSLATHYRGLKNAHVRPRVAVRGRAVTRHRSAAAAVGGASQADRRHRVAAPASRMQMKPDSPRLRERSKRRLCSVASPRLRVLCRLSRVSRRAPRRAGRRRGEGAREGPTCGPRRVAVHEPGIRPSLHSLKKKKNRAAWDCFQSPTIHSRTIVHLNGVPSKFHGTTRGRSR